MIDLGLVGKRAVVSGAGRGPGRAGHGPRSAMNLAEAGATVACIDMVEERARSTVEMIEKAGGKAFVITADMTDSREADRAIEEAVGALGGLDVCVDIIGKAHWDKVEELSDEAWDWSIRYNLTQVFYLFRAAARHMIRQGTGGSLVALASVDGFTGAPYHADYGAAKAGTVHLIKTFADELGRYGIRVNGVAPGAVGTGGDDQPEGVYGMDSTQPLAAPRAQDIADGVLFLSSRLASRVTGQTLIVDGGAATKGVFGRDESTIPETNARLKSIGLYDDLGPRWRGSPAPGDDCLGLRPPPVGTNNVTGLD
jgi:NAD(P)-dependent dehydrogenase (short-subunit alcohol dehydrogenase family)